MEEDHLVLTTIHQAKGLEWDAVFVIGICEGQFPHSRSADQGTELEEERRLFYVAVTRAKKFLHLVHPAIRYDYQQGAVVAGRSKFLEELPEDDYEVWQVSGRKEDPGYQDNWDDEETIIDL